MTFENRIKRQIDPDKLAEGTLPMKEGVSASQIENEDFSKPELAQTSGDTDNPESSIDLTGGQPRNDNGGIDISHYSGPESKTSSQIDAEHLQFKTSPGNGISADPTASRETGGSKDQS